MVLLLAALMGVVPCSAEEPLVGVVHPLCCATKRPAIMSWKGCLPACQKMWPSYCCFTASIRLHACSPEWSGARIGADSRWSGAVPSPYSMLGMPSLRAQARPPAIEGSCSVPIVALVHNHLSPSSQARKVNIQMAECSPACRGQRGHKPPTTFKSGLSGG